jgi:hypothetical protein
MQDQRIGVYVSSPRELPYVDYIRSIANVVVFTNSELVSEYFKKQQSNCIFLNAWKSDLKKYIKNSNFNYIILFSDAFSPEAFWIQKQNRTILIPTLPSFGADYKYFRRAAEAAETSLLKFYVVRILGIYQNCNSARYNFLKSYGQIFYFFLKKIKYGFNPQELMLGGRFADRIFAPNEQWKQAYLNIGIDKSKIDISGSIASAADEYQMQCLYHESYNQDINIKVRQKTDVLLISQPFSNYSSYKELWFKELESFINDCKDNNLSYKILMHPSDDISMLPSIVDRNSIISSYKYITILDLYVETKSCRLVVIKSSSLVNSVIRLKAPIAHINYHNMQATLDFKQCILNEMVLNDRNGLGKIFSYLTQNSAYVINNQIKQSKKYGCVEYDHKFKKLLSNLKIMK